MVKSALAQIVGRRIVKEAVEAHRGQPQSQVFLCFEDDSNYSLFSSEAIHTTGGIDRGGTALQCRATKDFGLLFAAFEDTALQEQAAANIIISRLVEDLVHHRRECLVDSLRVALMEGLNWAGLYEDARTNDLATVAFIAHGR